jgi:PAS domain S-box-containing protein
VEQSRAVSDGSDRLAELESFLGTVPGMIYRTRLVPPYDVEFLSDEAGTVAGYPAGDFVGSAPKRRYHELIEPEDREKLGEAMSQLPPDGSIAEVEYRLRRADGSVAWILTRARKVVAPDGTPWVHGAAVDVTARHEAAELRTRLETERARTAEIEASRARIVEAADGARRKLERDLHDGAQQHLVVASLTLRRAAAHVTGTPAGSLVSEALDYVQDGLAGLRDLAHGLHPAILSERGLGPALEGLASRSPVPVDLRVVDERVSPTAEAAIYFTVAEALTNVAKYAEATRARVAVELEDGALVCEVADDGVGGATPAGGSGLRGLADRLDALGGTLDVEGPRGRGTVVRARAPLA